MRRDLPEAAMVSRSISGFIAALLLIGSAAAQAPTTADVTPTSAASPQPTSSAPSPQQPTSSAPSPQSAATPDAYLNRIVCREYPPPTGTRIGARKVCKTAHQWQIEDNALKADQESVREHIGGSGMSGH
jgi:hypothetical protein